MSLAMFLHILILLGGVQGLITGTILFVERKSRRANYYLGALIWLMALASINLFLEYTGWYYSSTTLAILHNLVPLVIIMPAGPLLYFYVRASLDPTFRITKKWKLHFVPAIIDFIPSLASLIFILGVKLKVLFPDARPWGIFVDYVLVYSDIPRWISLTFYTIASLKYFNSFGSNASKNQVEINKWLQQFIRIFLVFQFIWLLYLIPYVIPTTTDFILETFSWYPVYIPLTFLIYWLGIKGLIVTYKNKKSTGVPALSPAIIQDVLSKLKNSMEEQGIFLNPDLNLDTLSRQIGFPSKIVSVVLNQALQKSFSEYVNGYRVEEVKRRLEENPGSNLTILGVALECGFNSKASFQRIFKEMTGVSPGALQKKASKGK